MLAAAMLLFLLHLGPAQVAEAQTQGAGVPGADLLLLLDRSGSMQQYDPFDLSSTSARLLVEMLDPSDRIAVILFDAGARTLLPLTPVGDGSAARAALGSIGRSAGQWTDIAAALQAALAQLQDGTRSEEGGSGNRGASSQRQPTILLFTDGHAETGPNGVPPAYATELRSEVAKLARQGIAVYTVGLGAADYELLQQIARGTGSESFAATTPAEVVGLFAGVLERIKERHLLLSYEEELRPGMSPADHSFQVPPYTRLLTLSAVSVGGSVQLHGVMPSGQPLTKAVGLRSVSGSNYQVYTIPDPAPGLWHSYVEGAGPAQVYVQTESSIRLELIAPAPFSQVFHSQSAAVTVRVSGAAGEDPPFQIWAQAGGGEVVKLAPDGHTFQGVVPISDGRLSVWAVLGGMEVTRREFKLYVDSVGSEATAELGPEKPGAWRRVVPGLVISSLALAILALGQWNWGRMRRREEVLSGRLGPIDLREGGRLAAIGPGPVLLPRGGPHALAWLEAQLHPLSWSPLVGLGLGSRRVRIKLRAAPGIRLQINGGPLAEGWLAHGDRVMLGPQMLLYVNPRLARRPASRLRTRRPASMRSPRTTLHR